MKLLQLLLATSLTTVSIATAKPIAITKRAVGTQYDFTLDDGTELSFKVGGVSGTGQSYNDGDVQEVMNILTNEVPAGSGGVSSVSGSTSGYNGGTLSAQFELGLYADWSNFSDGDWQQIFDEVVDITDSEDWPSALSLTLSPTADVGSIDDGVLTLKFVA